MKFSKSVSICIALFLGLVAVVILGLMDPAKHNPRQETFIDPARNRSAPVRIQGPSFPIPGNEVTNIKDNQSTPSPNPASADLPKPSWVETNIPLSQTQISTAQAGQKQTRQLQDPLARVALAAVGVDSDAEAYWLESIFDTTLPDKEREDLMEDLNEEGFVDPKNPTEDDLPLILARMQIIEIITPFADDFMLQHLGEAYKDLYNLLNGQEPQ